MLSGNHTPTTPFFDDKRIKEYLEEIEELHLEGGTVAARWEVGLANQLLWANCCDAKTTNQLRDRRIAALARLGPIAKSCVIGAEQVMELLAVKITSKAVNSFKEYLSILDKSYQKECASLHAQRVLKLNIDHKVPAPENEVFRLTEIILPRLEKFCLAASRTEQESIYVPAIERYIQETLDRIEEEEPPCWANICIVAPILRRINELVVECLSISDEPIDYRCYLSNEEWNRTASGSYVQTVFFEIEKGQPLMSNIRLSLEGRDEDWATEIGDYDEKFPVCVSFPCVILPTEEELRERHGVLHFRLTYHLENPQYLKGAQTQSGFRKIQFDREFKFAKDHGIEKDLSVGAWLRDRQVERPKIESALHDSDVVGDYEIVGMIGRGGSGEVYSARHRVLGTRVAIKFLFKDSENTRDRFTNEAKILAEEKYDGFPQFFAFGEVNGRPYLVEELLSPCDFPNSDEGVASFLLQFCPTIDYLHKRGYVHRDIKPSNILFRNDRPILVDFGLVKKIENQMISKERLSLVDGYVVGVGTPGYASPEQLLGEDLDITTDIHAIGMMIAEFFENKLPPQWEAIVNKATNSRRQARYQSIDEFLAAVKSR